MKWCFPGVMLLNRRFQAGCRLSVPIRAPVSTPFLADCSSRPVKSGSVDGRAFSRHLCCAGTELAKISFPSSTQRVRVPVSHAIESLTYGESAILVFPLLEPTSPHDLQVADLKTDPVRHRFRTSGLKACRQPQGLLQTVSTPPAQSGSPTGLRHESPPPAPVQSRSRADR